MSDLMMLQRVAERAFRLEAAPKVPKMAEMAVLGVFFEHLYTGVNGVGIIAHQHPLLVVCNAPSSLTSASP